MHREGIFYSGTSLIRTSEGSQTDSTNCSDYRVGKYTNMALVTSKDRCPVYKGILIREAPPYSVHTHSTIQVYVLKGSLLYKQDESNCV